MKLYSLFSHAPLPLQIFQYCTADTGRTAKPNKRCFDFGRYDTSCAACSSGRLMYTHQRAAGDNFLVLHTFMIPVAQGAPTMGLKHPDILPTAFKFMATSLPHERVIPTTRVPTKPPKPCDIFPRISYYEIMLVRTSLPPQV